MTVTEKLLLAQYRQLNDKAQQQVQSAVQAPKPLEALRSLLRFLTRRQAA